MQNTSIFIGMSEEDFERKMRAIIREEVRGEMYNTSTAQIATFASNENYITRQETAKMLRISLQGLTKYMSEGRVPYHKLGRRTLFKRSEVEKALSNQKPHGNRRKAAVQ